MFTVRFSSAPSPRVFALAPSLAGSAISWLHLYRSIIGTRDRGGGGWASPPPPPGFPRNRHWNLSLYLSLYFILEREELHRGIPRYSYNGEGWGLGRDESLFPSQKWAEKSVSTCTYFASQNALIVFQEIRYVFRGAIIYSHAPLYNIIEMCSL